ncbi:nicotinate-nucleotide adenylyltransferase [Sphaerisporangium aureirubrum]|uniref:Probable nicotinate-nucleotide adenylyltransferase n=1 Tax=Sphaerisporangium aureirubrum TaxID=1544736 RepID=A0ABW1NTR9_9ACTN
MGGTFDPIHNAHLSKAAAVANALAFDHVLFVPAGDPWQKPLPPVSGEHRLAMLTLATRHDPRFGVSRMEIDRPGPSYTVDTLRELRGLYGDRVRLFLVMGADAYAGIGTWREPEALFELAQLVVCARNGYPPPERHTAVTPVTLTVPEVSSTAVRALVRRQVPVGHLVPAAVESYIKAHGLYRETSSSTPWTASATRSGL